MTHQFFKYDRLIRLYNSVFGADRVLAVPYESLVRTPQDFVDRICRFVNVRVPDDFSFRRKANARSTYQPYLMPRTVVPLIRGSVANAHNPTPLGGRLGKRVHLGLVEALRQTLLAAPDRRAKRRLLERIDEIANDTYVESNRGTEALTGFNRGDLGDRI